jgi:putative membrane protein
MAKKLFGIAGAASIILIAVSAFGATMEEQLPMALPQHTIWNLLFHCSLFGGLGIVLVIVGFKIFDWMITKIDLEAEINKGNVAAAILSAAVILGISVIVASAIH